LKQQVGEFNGHPRIVEFAAPGPHAAARDERTARLEMRQRGLFLLRWPACKALDSSSTRLASA
jgi:hypothetical protein